MSETALTRGVHHVGLTVPDRAHAIGLHHLALAVPSHTALDAVYDRLRNAAGVQIEFAPEALGTGGARHLMCTIPGGVRVEFTAAP